MYLIRGQFLRLLLGTAATIAFTWLFLREVDLGEAWAKIRELPAWTLLGAVALLLVNVGVMAFRWRLLLHGAGYRVPLRLVFATVSVGRAANNVVPARGGDLLRIVSMREVGAVPAFVTAGTLFAERLLDGVVLATWILLGALAIGQGGIPLLAGIALSSGTVLGLVLVAVAARRPEASARFASRATSRLPTRWRPRASRSALHFVEGLGTFRRARHVAVVLATSALMWLADVLMFALVGHAYGVDLGLGGYFLLEGIGNLALAVPATAAGLGSFDYLTFLAAREIDVEEHAASAYVLTMHALIILPVTILGALLIRPALPRLFRTRPRAREAG
ncbi:MAG: flippase-like domain-containing protein [Thermoleophilia bacterium]|nr:flippase-like domain-containing protein [Thermoleophilia bacterium]